MVRILVVTGRVWEYIMSIGVLTKSEGQTRVCVCVLLGGLKEALGKQVLLLNDIYLVIFS